MWWAGPTPSAWAAPVTPGEPSVPVKTSLRASVGAKRGGADMPAAPGTILEDFQLREYAVSMPDSAPAASATYGSTPSRVLQFLASLHLATKQQEEQPVQTDALDAAAPQEPATSATTPAPWVPPSWPAPKPATRSLSRRPSGSHCGTTPST